MEKSYIAINAWAEEDRPREKMLLKGYAALSDAELIAILLGSGSKGESAVALSQRILASVGNNLNDLGKRSLKDLQKFKGVGEAKAITVAAALELGRRRQLSDISIRPKVSNSRDAYDAIASLVVDLKHEEFWVLWLNRANEIFGRERMSSGGTAGTVVDIKIILKSALEVGAAGFIAVHNHPSGNARPSHQDEALTRKLKQAGALLEIPLLDHLIIADRQYYSFADEGGL